MDLDNSRNAARSEGPRGSEGAEHFVYDFGCKGRHRRVYPASAPPPERQLWWRNRLENARRKPAVTGLNPLLTDGLDGRCSIRLSYRRLACSVANLAMTCQPSRGSLAETMPGESRRATS